MRWKLFEPRSTAATLSSSRSADGRLKRLRKIGLLPIGFPLDYGVPGDARQRDKTLAFWRASVYDARSSLVGSATFLTFPREFHTGLLVGTVHTVFGPFRVNQAAVEQDRLLPFPVF